MPHMANTVVAKILVVDDEPYIREFLHQVLTDDGYTVVTAGDGEEALLVAEREKPDLILLDIKMPKLDGMATCQELRKRPVTKNCRIIMLTAFDTRDRLEESIVSGADDFLGKPVDLTELQVRVRSMLKVKDMADEVDRLEAYIKSMKDLREQA
jgi:putative two-component system response regulator